MTSPNLPTALVIAASPESDFGPFGDPLLRRVGTGTLLERHIDMLAGLGCRRFVVVASIDAQAALEQLRDRLSIQLRSVPAPDSLAEAFIAAEPPLAHFATGPVLVTQPHYAAESGLYVALLDAWTNRPSGVEGIIATARPREPHSDNLRFVLSGDRLTGCIVDGEIGIDGDAREYVGAMTYSWSRELCETIGEEADKRGHGHAIALGLNRLMAWNDIRNLDFAGSWHRLEVSDEPRVARTSDHGPPAVIRDRNQLQRPYSPR